MIFRGFSRVCQHLRFDDKDRKDIRTNRSGTQGPPGPQGPEGPAGQINVTNTYQVTGNRITTVETPTRTFSAVFCDPGDIVLEGGGGVGAFADGGLSNVFL